MSQERSRDVTPSVHGRRSVAHALARLRLVGAAIAFRGGSSAALFLLAVGAAIAAAVGPLYLVAADGSELASALATAAPYRTGLSIATATVSATPATARQFARAASDVPAASGGGTWYGAPIVTIVAGGSIPGPESYILDIVARTGECAHLTFSAGTCPTKEGEVALTSRSAARIGARLGQELHVPRSGEPPASLRVVGLYLPGDPNAPYWWGQDYFVFNRTSSPSTVPLDAFFATPATVLAFGGGHHHQELVQIPLRAAAIHLADVAPLRAQLAQLETGVAPRLGVAVTSGLPGVLDGAASAQSTTASVVLVTALQLVLLALLVLYVVAARTSESREPELALAALRGLKVRSSVALAMLEPTVLLAAAMPAGLLIAWGGIVLAAPHLLPAGASPGVTWAAVGAVGVVLVAGMSTLALASRRLLRPSLAGDLRVAIAGPRRSRANALEGAVLAITVGALVELFGAGVSSVGRTDALAAFAPGLLAIAVGLAGRRLLSALSRLGARLTPFSRKVAAFLAFRHVARRSATWRQLVEIAVAASLAAFAVSAWLVSSSGRTAQANFVNGAPTVLTVSAVAPSTLEADVRAADPSGRLAMAAVGYATSSEQMLAVDASRLAAVVGWPAGVSTVAAARLAAQLHPPSPPAILLGGAGVRLEADTTPSAGLRDRPTLDVDVFDLASQFPVTLDLGQMAAGDHTYTATFDDICQRGCRLTGIAPAWPSSVSSASLSVTIQQIEDGGVGGRWRPVAAGIDDPADWRATSATIREAGAGPNDALQCRFVLGSGGNTPMIDPVDAPALLPAIFTPQLEAADQSALQPGGSPVEDVDGSTIDAKVVGTASTLPQLGEDGLLVDLGYASLDASGPPIFTTDEVWLSTSAYAPIERRLRALGLRTLSVQSASTIERREAGGAPALADRFLLVSGALALLLAAGTCLVLLLLERRQRAATLAALAATGVRRRTLLASLLVEQGIVVVAGALLGAAAGGAAAWLALRSAPVVEVLPGGPPLTDAVPFLALAACAAAVLVALGAATVVGVAASMRAAGTSMLREKPR